MNAMRRLALCLLFLGAATPVLARDVHTGDGDFRITCTAGPPKSDYVAETQAGVALTDPYAVTRGLDKGLVRLMDQGGRRVTRYAVPRNTIRAILRVALDSEMPDRLDLLFTAAHVIAVHTQAGNAGIFTGSDVYTLATSKAGLDKAPLDGNLKARAALGLNTFPPGRGCVPAF
jgi:hypothetical protein